MPAFLARDLRDPEAPRLTSATTLARPSLAMAAARLTSETPSEVIPTMTPKDPTSLSRTMRLSSSAS